MARIKKTAEIRIDEDRIFDALNVERMIALADVMSAFASITQRTNGIDLGVFAGMGESVRHLRDFVGEFIWDGTGYLSVEDARPVVGKLSMRQLIDAVSTIQDMAEESAVPQSSGGISDSD